MRRWFAALGSLALFASSGAAAQDDVRLTLAEARGMSPDALATRLLGTAVAADYPEADVHGDGGGMIPAPGLNYITFYRAPVPAGFPGLCRVDGLVVRFENGPPNSRSDAPHRVVGRDAFTRYLMLAPGTAEGRPATDAAGCAALAPVAGRTAPRLFSVRPDTPESAYFAARAAATAVGEAESLRGRIRCNDMGSDAPASCRSPSEALAGFPVADVHAFEVARCDGERLCVTAHWRQQLGFGCSPVVDVTVETSARRTDPSPEIRIRSVDYVAGTLCVD
ncbi:hypothetical protein [Sphingosinithalassobacter sp. CS137]|uniref:hypothetical protein n=1 Tax=Sphingosinithalassobacter sp. CS137 TaxID=2762748 RepID=UPI00165DF625|nr:hypothetical protein [Sphingosinithalassobacter sp. CS137]